MVEHFNKETLLEFLEQVKRNVIFDVDNLIDIKELFLECFDCNQDKLSSFISSLPEISKSLKKDLDFYMISDPAITSKEEVVVAYPGFKAISSYRIAHKLHELGFNLNSRIITEDAHTLTGIDIHPGATIGVPFFIDHGTGIVIGETAVVGTNVKLYQGVTLGALSLSKGSAMKGIKRHPTVGNNVTIYAGASILGDITIGDNVTIGSNVFLTDNVPSNTRVVISKPELIVSNKK